MTLTQIFQAHQEAHLKKAVQLMKEGKLIAFPTETVYGLGAPVFSRDSISKIFEAKGRPQDNPLIVHISSLEQIEQLCEDIPDDFYLLAEKFFPGPLTIILKKNTSVSDLVSAGLSTIGVRMPKNPVARQLIELLGEPIAAPSANLSGRPSATSALHVLEDLNGKIAAVIDGGSCEEGIESTVLALEPTPIIYRPGSVTKEMIEEVLQKEISVVDDKKTEKPISPGLKYRHYAPNAQVLLFDLMENLEAHILNSSKKKMVLTSLQQGELYEKLRQADREAFDEVLIFCGFAEITNLALMNRLKRASHK